MNKKAFEKFIQNNQQNQKQKNIENSSFRFNQQSLEVINDVLKEVSSQNQNADRNISKQPMKKFINFGQQALNPLPSDVIYGNIDNFHQEVNRINRSKSHRNVIKNQVHKQDKLPKIQNQTQYDNNIYDSKKNDKIKFKNQINYHLFQNNQSTNLIQVYSHEKIESKCNSVNNNDLNTVTSSILQKLKDINEDLIYDTKNSDNFDNFCQNSNIQLSNSNFTKNKLCVNNNESNSHSDLSKYYHEKLKMDKIMENLKKFSNQKIKSIQQPWIEEKAEMGKQFVYFVYKEYRQQLITQTLLTDQLYIEFIEKQLSQILKQKLLNHENCIAIKEIINKIIDKGNEDNSTHLKFRKSPSPRLQQYKNVEMNNMEIHSDNIKNNEIALTKSKIEFLFNENVNLIKKFPKDLKQILKNNNNILFAKISQIFNFLLNEPINEFKCQEFNGSQSEIKTTLTKLNYNLCNKNKTTINKVIKIPNIIPVKWLGSLLNRNLEIEPIIKYLLNIQKMTQQV